MRSVDIQEIDNLKGRKLTEKDTFSFHCHSGLGCFNQCCRNLNLFLYPYDVICLKNRLGISSDRFLDSHVDVVLRPDNFFPAVLLRMQDDKEKTCPFLTDSGCSVYEDRPDTCRTFPMEQGLVFSKDNNKSELIYILRPPDFCLGQYEKREMSIKTWAIDQEAMHHNMMTQKWAQLKGLFQSDPYGNQGPDGPKGKMAFMSVYNIDKFREFIFISSFLKRYKVKTTLLKAIKKDDVALIKFGFSWVKFYLWGIPTKNIRLR